MVVIDIEINNILGRLTLDPAGMHCRAWDDAFVSSYRQDATKRHTAGIKFTDRSKFRLFAPQGRIVEPINVKRGSADGHVSTFGCAKFHPNRHRGVGMRTPKYQKFPPFGK